MPTYTFRGRDMSEAVEQVRNTLGSDAVIIDTLRGTDHIGRFVEITATGELKANQEIYTQPHEQSNPIVNPRTRQLTQRRTGISPPPRSANRVNAAYQSARSYQNSRGPGSIPAPSYVEPRVYQEDAPMGSRRPGAKKRTNLSLPQKTVQSPSYASQNPVKGADRYIHPNSFSSQRDVIIPQPAPVHTQPNNHVASHNDRLVRQPLTSPNRRLSPHHKGNHSPSHPTRVAQHIAQNLPQQSMTPNPSAHQATPYTLSSPLGYQQQKTPAPESPAVPVPNHLQNSVKAVQGMMNTQGTEAVQFVTERLNEIVNYIQSGQNSHGIPAPVFDHLRQFNRQLQATGIERKYADQLIEETKARIRLNQLDKQVILAHLGQVLAQNINCIDPLEFDSKKKNVLAFIGPTGVGKTTTIAKIAAHAHLTHEIPVTLISTDTFRMAAVEQLSRYAEILDCPSQAANNPEELWRLVDEAQTPLVLVDTTGRNPKVAGQLKVLSEFFGDTWQGRTVLTVAANTREQDLKPIVEGFSPLKYDMVTVTKLDETYALGTIYNVSKYTQCPIAWMTNGQRVPEDIELANPESVAVKIIMEAISHKV